MKKDQDLNQGLSEERNRGFEVRHAFDEPTWAPSSDESDHPELWEHQYLWHPQQSHAPTNPDDPWPPAQNDPNGPLLRLSQRLADRVGHKVTTKDPEYWGLAGWITDDMLKVTKHMKIRKPMTLAEVAAACRMSEEEVKPILDDAAQAGLLEYNWENETHTKQWVLPVQIPGMGEFYAMNERMLEEQPQMATYFERIAYVGPAQIAAIVPPGGGGVGMHVIPVEQAIEMENESLDVEHISHWLDKYDKFAASTCSCRMSNTVRGTNSGDDPEDWCIGVGDMADYEVQTGKGRYITKEEALQIIQKAEDNGFVHQITNIDGTDKIFAICNCNKSVCYGIRTSQLFNTPNFSRSAYVAHVTPDNCVACGQCVENCPAGAVRLGQRLCNLDGPVSYPHVDLPDDLDWGPERWDPEYYDTNRNECYDSGTAPCKVACPAHIAIEGYLKLAAQGRYTEALALIKKENPFPAVCGRVCNHLCEDVCTRARLDQAIAIEAVKRFIADRDLDADTRYIPPVVQPSLRGPYTNKIAIIGAGPAGLTCAYYLATMGYAPTVFERNPLPGGMMVYGIPTYKLQKDVVAAEIDVLRELGVEIRCGVDVGSDVTLDELRAQGFEAFYLAIGAQGARTAGIEGEKGADVLYAIDFLHDVLDGDVTELDGTTVVLGGGNVAIDAAEAARRTGSDVSMWCLETEDIAPAALEEREMATADGIAINYGWGPARIDRDQAGKLVSVTFKRCTSVFDDEGRFSPTYDEDDTMCVPCDRVIMSIGQTIEWGNLLDGTTVELDRAGRAVADAKTYQTAHEDVFVGGDAYTGPSFVINAIAAGHEAAISIHRYVQPGNSLTRGRNQRNYIPLDRDALDLAGYDTAPRQVPPVDPDIDTHLSFEDWHLAFTEEQVKAETARCLQCGASYVDPNKCIGCGVCTTKCDFDAIHLSRDLPECSDMYNNDDKLKAIIPYALKRRVKIIKRKREDKREKRG